MKRFFFLSIVLAFSLLLFTACSEAEESGQTDSGNDDVDQNEEQDQDSAVDRDLVSEGLPEYNEDIANLPDTTIEVWLAADYVEEDPVVGAINEFMEVYPNITVESAGHTWQDMQNQVRLAVNGGAPPDLAHQHAFAMGSQGLAEPVDDLWEEWGIEEEFLPGAVDNVTWEGTKYGVPIDINTTFYLYNTEMFEEKGLEPPTTLEEFTEVTKAVADDGVYGFVPSASGWGLQGWIVAQGGDVLKEVDGQLQPDLNNETVLEVVEAYTEVATVHGIAPIPPAQARQSDHPVAMFGNERAAAIVSGPFDISRIENEFPDMYDKVGTAPIPGNDQGSVAGGGSMFVPRGSENREVSFELMKWIISDKYGIRMAAEMGRHPVKEHLYEDELYDDPLLTPFVETLPHAEQFYLEAYPEANDAHGQAFRNVFDGDDVEEAFNEAQRLAEEAFEREAQ
ncbi:ABC transporter substrate-binding protein [Evansella halocellulosilytica]|uniref:ABC transporter substrate-binding protein n=1 Tax=Evansella halocellulosilytica TaxID=2011013 RepID=UPI000BB8645E|nr:sugar ABC transporter substrate-binding protein [Evansella halocellulosilytica]